MKKRILYIINPKSGAGRKDEIPGLVESLTDTGLVEARIRYTDAPKHATVLAAEAVMEGYDVVVAVGGDGSVNEAGKALTGTRTALGIIPMGSGNGLARHLGIPLKPEDAIPVINKGSTIVMDTVRVNDEFCAGTIGIGFDAHVAHLFAKSSKRGYSTYVKLVLTEFYKYKPNLFRLVVDGNEIEKECFLLTFANSSQFGNNAVIAPFADVQDGILDVSMMKKFPVLVAPHLIYRMMNNVIHKSRFFEMTRGREVTVRNTGTILGHIDGEPVTFNGDLNIRLVPSSMKVVIG